MKGHIAFCPHFHQPHFQLYKVREEVFKNSYAEWLALIEESVNQNGFFINIHLSGSFIYWLKDQKPNAMKRLKHLVKTGKVGIIGGFADEAFSQLSSRKDDIYFQIKEYENLCQDFLGIRASEWQGIHITERECGEFLLKEVSDAANLVGAIPLYYLDAETFFESHFSDVGGNADYCLKHFNFNDPVAKTTLAHMPKQMLYFGLRDKIAGTEFYCLPIHSEHRYRLLKNNSFADGDKILISPAEYFSHIKFDLEQAWELAQNYGKIIEPIAVIFEDAEKLGHWSGNSVDDRRWLTEFFKIVEKDPSISFTGLKDYIVSKRFLDTYPIRTSQSYPEWDNWTAKRGIRGVVFADERLRRTITRLHSFEESQNRFESKILDMLNISQHSDIICRAVCNSNERFVVVENLLAQFFGNDVLKKYCMINRIRNILYQEDPKWASRHPNYGIAPYFDSNGLAYLEIAERVLYILLIMANLHSEDINIVDWDGDGEDEVVIKTLLQTLSIDMQGGCIDYHFVLATKLKEMNCYFDVLNEHIKSIPTYHSIHKYAIPLVLTETDSSIKRHIKKIEHRKEQCRNSFRCDLYSSGIDGLKKIGNISNALFELKKIEQDSTTIKITCGTSISIKMSNGNEAIVICQKEFVIKDDELIVTITASSDNTIGTDMFLAPQIVSSLTPSDEVMLKPFSRIILNAGEHDVSFSVNDIMLNKQGIVSYSNIEGKMKWSGDLTYYCENKTGNDDRFVNAIHCNIESPEQIKYIKIEPAIKNYYEGFVNESQSRLGYNSSGIMIVPFVDFKDDFAKVTVGLKWMFDQVVPISLNSIDLIKHV